MMPSPVGTLCRESFWRRLCRVRSGGGGEKEERVKEGERGTNMCENNGCNIFLVGKCECKIVHMYIIMGRFII